MWLRGAWSARDPWSNSARASGWVLPERVVTRASSTGCRMRERGAGCDCPGRVANRRVRAGKTDNWEKENLGIGTHSCCLYRQNFFTGELKQSTAGLIVSCQWGSVKERSCSRITLMGDCFSENGTGACMKKGRTLWARPLGKLEMDYGTVTVTWVLWTVEPETAVIVKV